MPGSHAVMRLAIRGFPAHPGRGLIAIDPYRGSAMIPRAAAPYQRGGLPHQIFNTRAGAHWHGHRAAAGDFWSNIGGALKSVAGVALPLLGTALLPGIGTVLGGLAGKALQGGGTPRVGAGGTVGPGMGGVIKLPSGLTMSGGIGMSPYGLTVDPSTGGAIDMGGGGTAMVPSGACAIKGYHLNKHGYFTHRDGWIPPHSKCVKNRHRNPLNPRAARHAAGRLHGFQKLVARVERVVRRAAAPKRIGGGPRASGSGMRGHKTGCRCFGCKR